MLSVEVVDGGWVAGEKVRYESPEALLASQEMNTVATSELRPPVDVWSFACIMLELATGQRPYAQVLLKRYVQKLGSPAVHILLQNPRAHALGFFQPALGFLPIVAYFGRFLPWISLTNPKIFSTIYALFSCTVL